MTLPGLHPTNRYVFGSEIEDAKKTRMLADHLHPG
jgi:hypothetical protein